MATDGILSSSILLCGSVPSSRNGRRDASVVETTPSLSLVAYPVLTLPPEIVSLIFVQCLPVHGRVRPSPGAAPLLLAQICSDWREIALTTCQLWSSVYISSGVLHSGKSSERALCLLQLWVSRAKEHTLSLGVDKDPKDGLSSLLTAANAFSSTSFQKQVSPALLSFISSLSAQIWRLEVYLSPTQFSTIQSPHRPFPLLRCLTRPCAPEARLRALLEDTPSLRELHLLSPGSTLHLSSDVLTSLQVEPTVTIQDFFNFFANFPALVRLKCTLEDLRPAQMPNKPVIHQHLSSLNLGGPESTGVLSGLVLPQLRSLEVADFLWPDGILNFVSHSACVLHTLSVDMGVEGSFLDGFEGPGQRLADFLAALPSIESMYFVCIDMGLLLTSIASSPSVLPQLTKLSITATHAGSDCDPLVVFLRRRRNPIGADRLQSVHITLLDRDRESELDSEDDPDYEDYGWPQRRGYEEFTWPPPDPVASELKGFVAEGLDLVLKVRRESEGCDGTEWRRILAEYTQCAFSLSCLTMSLNIPTVIDPMAD
ncbi:hypothetical protein B0H16DRAFT_1893796 [Mycena metata]|uniref:F-box domain-containing protein n=1 Tax=Mycena metata TaxID=1033252 RepID=A0AAD7HW90_9AGAR|nr:hypothetical protein B0H16DRAFT_1893796 [Mycena metata]